MKLLSLLADIGFAVSLIVLALIVLTLLGHLRTALCWGGGMILSLGLVVMIKRAMVHDPALPHFPSGHVAVALTFYGGLILVLLWHELPATPWRALFFLGVLGAVALAEGTSRVALTEHSWTDVLGGFVVGIAGLLLTGNPWSWRAIGRKDRFWLAGVLATAIPFNWLVYPHLDSWIREFVGV